MADSSISLVACSLVGNEAKRDGGGALIAGYSTVTAVGGLFANNFVGRDGAGLAVVDSASFSAEGAEVIELRNNSASQDGGAMLFSSDGVVKLSSQMIRISKNLGFLGAPRRYQTLCTSCESDMSSPWKLTRSALKFTTG